MDFVLNSILSDTSTAHHPHPDILTMSVCLKYLFYPIIFSIFVSFTLNWVSCRQQIVGFWLFILSLCLLIWTFNPLNFKVFLDRYVNIPIFKLCFSVDVVVLYSFVHFSPPFVVWRFSSRLFSLLFTASRFVFISAI